MKKTASLPRKAAAVKSEISAAASTVQVAKVSPAVRPAVEAAQRVSQEQQRAAFDKASALFQSGDFTQAGKLFAKAASGPMREMAHSARMRARICERRTSQEVARPSGAAERYNLGVALINQRQLEEAERHLKEGLSLDPHGDHILYALALAQALRGEVQAAHENLKRAIELDPRNRTRARSDPDFAAFLHRPPLNALLAPEKESGA